MKISNEEEKVRVRPFGAKLTPRKQREVKHKNKQKSISSESSSSLNKSKSIDSNRKNSSSVHLDSNKSKQNKEVKTIQLIKTKLENVLKEKFTWVDLIADENSAKILEDLNYLEKNDIKINYLWMTQISKSLHRFERYLKQKYK